ncbi:MAG TPA: feruloyl-CoA synthase [Bryobacteraceae bacterium]|nr:feruloyl-CoA synthase [Bryobacteraceae bacterium]
MEVALTRASNGSMYVIPVHPLGQYPAKLTERLEFWAERAPDRVFLGQRDRDGNWRTKTYAETREAARNIAQALLYRVADGRISAERPIAILSSNDIEQALLGLGAMYAGVPFAPISPAYSLLSSDFGKLRHIMNLLTPGLVFVAAATAYRKALDAAMPAGVELVVAEAASAPQSTSFSALERTRASDAVEESHAAVSLDTVAKILFTSGSTGNPKGVINTQRMLTSNQEIVRSVLAFVEDEPPVLCDWMPWNHTFGGNHDFGFALYNGGSIYIDEGRPVPGEMEKSVRNLFDVRPTVYLNAPKGFEALLPFLRENREFRECFFSRLRLFYYAGASLSQPVWDELQRLAVETCGERILIFTGLGSTETGPAALFPGWEVGRAGEVGIPAPGVELKLVPSGAKLEARLRGPSITPGYWRQPELTRAAFDEEGFYKLGDALRFVDPADVNKGFLFDGRIAEDFKLSTATWVSVGPLRMKFLARGAPYVRDVVIAGHDRDAVTALIFPDVGMCRQLCPEPMRGAPAAEILGSAPVRAQFQRLLEELAAESTGTSNRIVRAILLEEPPSIDAHEVTDKGSLNQGEVLRHRAALVEELYAPQPSPRVIEIQRGNS